MPAARPIKLTSCYPALSRRHPLENDDLVGRRLFVGKHFLLLPGEVIPLNPLDLIGRGGRGANRVIDHQHRQHQGLKVGNCHAATLHNSS